MLIGYSGFCEKCGVERRMYFARCDQNMKKKMLSGLRGRLIYRGACENCLLHGLYDSVREWRLMSSVQVDKDLAILEGGLMDINFNQAESDAKENLKNDKWLEDNEKHVEDWNRFQAKKGL